jgi:hypothetical protein
VNESGLLLELGTAATLALPNRQDICGSVDEVCKIDLLLGVVPRKGSGENVKGSGWLNCTLIVWFEPARITFGVTVTSAQKLDSKTVYVSDNDVL